MINLRDVSVDLCVFTGVDRLDKDLTIGQMQGEKRRADFIVTVLLVEFG